MGKAVSSSSSGVESGEVMKEAVEGVLVTGSVLKGAVEEVMTASRVESGLTGVSQLMMSLPAAEQMRESASSEVEGGGEVQSVNR